MTSQKNSLSNSKIKMIYYNQRLMTKHIFVSPNQFLLRLLRKGGMFFPKGAQNLHKIYFSPLEKCYNIPNSWSSQTSIM